MVKSLRRALICVLAAVFVSVSAAFAVLSFHRNVYAADEVLFTANGDYSQGASNSLSSVHGITTGNQSIWGGSNYTQETWVDMNSVQPSNVEDVAGNRQPAHFDIEAAKTGTDDGHALGAAIGSWGVSDYPVIQFKNTVNAALIDSVTFRVYANLSGRSPYMAYNSETGQFDAQTAGTSGIWIYGVGATGAVGEGVLLDPAITQNEWVELTFSGADLGKLADKNGNISGFTVGAAIIAGNADQLYDTNADINGGTDQPYDSCAIVYFDSVKASGVIEAGSTDAIASGAYLGEEVAGGRETIVVMNGEISFQNFPKIYSYAYGADGLFHLLTESGARTVDLSQCVFNAALEVSFYSGYGDNELLQTISVGAGNSLSVEPPVRPGYDFLYWSLSANGAEYDTSLPVTENLELFAVWKESVDDGKLSTAYGDYYAVPMTLTSIEGKNEMGGGQSMSPLTKTRDWNNVTLSSDPALSEAAVGSDDGHVFGTLLNGWGFTVLNGIEFSEPVAAADIDAITFRIYAHLSSGNTYALDAEGNPMHSSLGFWFYGPGKTGAAGEGILLPYGITQDAWTDFTISGDDLQKLADADGMISGFQFAGGIVNGGDNSVLYGFEGESYNSAPYILIDYVRASKFATVTYKDGDDVLKTEETLTWTNVSYIPEATGDGYVFTGWRVNDLSGRLFGFEEAVSGDLTLVADWQKAGDLSQKVGLYTPVQGDIMIFDDGTVRADESYGKVYYTAYGENDTLYLLTGSGRTEVALGEPVESVLVTYYGEQGEVCDRLLVEKNGQAPELSMEGDAFLYWSQTAGGAEFDFGTLLTEDISLYSVWKYGIEKNMITDAQAGYSLGNETTLTQLAGATSLNGGTVSSISEQAIESVSLTDERFDGSNDGYAFRMFMVSWGFTYGKPVYFSNPVAAEDIEGLTFRVYAHLSEKSPYGAFLHGGKGLRIYGIGADGSAGGVLVTIDISQDCWVDLVLSKEEAAMLADENGMISGFMLASGFIADSTDIANGWLYSFSGFNYESAPYILIDYVLANYNTEITYADGDQTLKTDTVLSGTAPESVYVPEKEGYVFTGWEWFGESYNFGEAINQDVTLYAKWVQAADAADVVGLYKEKEGDTRISLFSDGTLTVGGEKDFLAYGVGTDNVLYVTTEKGVAAYDLQNDFSKVTAFEITFEDGLGNAEKQFVEEGGTVTEPNFRRAGYKRTGWTVKGSDTEFDPAQAVTGNLTVVAVWAYDEVSPADYAGSYYSTGSMIVLRDDGKAEILGNEYGYHVLTSGEIVIDGYKTGTIYGTHIVIEGITYEKLGNVIVSFDAGDGVQAPESQTLSGDYKVTKPADPVREGYVFKGWMYPDGSDFNFDTVVTSSIRLMAKWEKSAEVPSDTTDDGEKTGCSGMLGGTEVLPVLAVLSAAAAGVIFIGRGKRRGE